MDEYYSKFDLRAEEIKDWLSSEFSNIRTGRATPAILDGVIIDVYGSKQPIKHSATIAIEDPRTIKITPWDKGQIALIESAISTANLGLSVSADSNGVRVSFPQLTEETRNNLVKLVKEKLEEARVSIKKERENVWSQINADEKESKITEDDKFKAKDTLQKHVDDANKFLDDLASKKETELREV